MTIRTYVIAVNGFDETFYFETLERLFAYVVQVASLFN